VPPFTRFDSTQNVPQQRETFVAFVEKTLEEVITLAEKTTQKTLPRKYAFQWLGKAHPRVTEGVVEHIVQRLYVDSEHIYPCVDIGVADLIEDGTLLIVANIAGYAPCGFGRNWTGRKGPFQIVGSPLIERMAGQTPKWTPESGAFSFSTPKYNPTEGQRYSPSAQVSAPWSSPNFRTRTQIAARL
jgi:hypothetical protein